MDLRVAGQAPGASAAHVAWALHVLGVEQRFAEAARRAKCSKRCLAKQ